jgi:Uri superfamily endonuclease
MKLTNGPASDRGAYVLLIFLQSEHLVTVGRLGRIRFRPGTYLYCGSAMAGYRGRVGRHFSKEKKLRWHIDYLLQVAEPVGAYLVHGGEGVECRLGDLISSLEGSEPIEGFGCSDCSCRSHLFLIDDGSIDALTELIGDLSARWGDQPEND